MRGSSVRVVSAVFGVALGVASLATGAVTSKDSLGTADAGKGSAPGQEKAMPVVKILEVQCGPNLTVPVHIQVQSHKGILAYSVWSTWGGSDQAAENFTPPLPKLIDKIVTIRHFTPDSIDRKHQIGLKVMLQGSPEPIFAYAMEPSNRCPGHYLPAAAKK